MAISEEFIDKIKQAYGGVSNSNLANIDSGALASLLTTDRKPIDPALLALIASAEMTRASSVPGATALGGFGSGIVKGAELKLASDLADRKADASQKSDAMTFLGKLATPKKAVTRKTLGTGNALNYMTEESAIKYLADRGITSDTPGFDDFIYKVTTTDNEKIGTPAIFAGKPLEFNLDMEGDVIKSVVTNQIRGSALDSTFATKQKKIELMNKNDKSIEQMTGLFPRLEQAKNILLNPDVKTGFYQTEPFMTFKQMLKSTFGFSDEDLADQQIIQSLSFQLAPMMRPVGSGSTSDMEFKAYQKGILSLQNEKKANYLNLYTLEKMTKNGIKLNKLEKQLLANPKNYSYKYIDDKIAEQDIGIFKKIYNDDDKTNRLFNNEGEPLFENNEDKKLIIKEYYNDLDNGDVFMNDDGTGNKLFEGIGTYVVKGLDLPRILR